MHLWGITCLLRGDNEAARQAFTEAIELSTVTGSVDNDILSEPELALLAIDDGDWALAGTYARRGLAAIDAGHMDGYPTTALALAVAARVAVHDGTREHGERLLSRAMVARVGCTYLMPWYSVRVRLNLAKAHVALGDRSAAWHLLREIDDLLHRRPDVGVLSDQVEDFRESLQAQRIGALLAERVLEDLAVYRLKPQQAERLREAGLRTGAVTVTSRGVEVTLAPR